MGTEFFIKKRVNGRLALIHHINLSPFTGGTFVTEPVEVLRTLGRLEWVVSEAGVYGLLTLFQRSCSLPK